MPRDAGAVSRDSGSAEVALARCPGALVLRKLRWLVAPVRWSNVPGALEQSPETLVLRKLRWFIAPGHRSSVRGRYFCGACAD